MADKDKPETRRVRESIALRRQLAELELVDSARRQVEEELRRERDRAQQYLDVAAVIIVVLNQDGRVTLINRKGCEILGYAESEILGKSWIDNFVSARMRQQFREVFNKLMAQEIEDPEYTENIILQRDGVERTIAWHNTILKDEAGAALGTLSSGEDITEKKRAQKALRESEAKLKSLFRVAPTGMGLASADRILIEVNDRFCEMLGHEREELIGRSARHLYADQREFEYVGAERERQLAEEGVANIETRVMRKDGKIIDILLGFSSLDPSDKSSNTIFTVLDITASKRIQSKMEKLNNLFLSLGTDSIRNMEKILRTAKEIIECAYADFSLVKMGEISCLGSDERGGFRLKASPSEDICHSLIERNAKEFLAIEDLQQTELAGTDPIITKYGFRSYLGYPVIVEGRTVGCLSLFDSERREYSSEDIEMAGMLAQALSVEQERLDREENLRDFIDVASHELRHPITIIKGYAVSLRELWEDLEKTQREELLRAVELGTDRLNRLTLELLDVSRIVRGRFPMNKEDILIKPLLEIAISRFEEEDMSNRCNLIIKGETGSVSADPRKLVDLMHILLDNASKYSPRDSEIDVEVNSREGQVVIAVLDRGMGVPDEYRDRIFERFFQVEDASHHSTPGMGMGLFIAKEIVEAHGGHIWYEARQGGGSAFLFTLPLETNTI